MNPTNLLPVIFTYFPMPKKQLGEGMLQGLGGFPEYCYTRPRKMVQMLQCESTFDVQHLICFV
jgi:hypothetical protein